MQRVPPKRPREEDPPPCRLVLPDAFFAGPRRPLRFWRPANLEPEAAEQQCGQEHEKLHALQAEIALCDTRLAAKQPVRTQPAKGGSDIMSTVSASVDVQTSTEAVMLIDAQTSMAAMAAVDAQTDTATVAEVDTQTGTEAVATIDAQTGTEAVGAEAAARIDAQTGTEAAISIDAQTGTEAAGVNAQTGTEAVVKLDAHTEMAAANADTHVALTTVDAGVQCCLSPPVAVGEPVDRSVPLAAQLPPQHAHEDLMARGWAGLMAMLRELEEQLRHEQSAKGRAEELAREQEVAITSLRASLQAQHGDSAALFGPSHGPALSPPPPQSPTMTQVPEPPQPPPPRLLPSPPSASDQARAAKVHHGCNAALPAASLVHPAVRRAGHGRFHEGQAGGQGAGAELRERLARRDDSGAAGAGVADESRYGSGGGHQDGLTDGAGAQGGEAEATDRQGGHVAAADAAAAAPETKGAAREADTAAQPEASGDAQPQEEGVTMAAEVEAEAEAAEAAEAAAAAAAAPRRPCMMYTQDPLPKI